MARDLRNRAHANCDLSALLGSGRGNRSHLRTVSPSPHFEVIPIGVGAAYGRVGEAQSCLLVRAGGKTICLDLGAGALNLLQRHVRPEALDLVVISHLHPDHFIDLLALRVYMVWGPGAGKRVRVAGPPGLRAQIAAFGSDGLESAFAFEELTGQEAATDLAGGLTVRHHQVPHLPPTYATRIDSGAGAMCFGADCAPNEVLATFAEGVDLLVTECSFGVGDIPDGVAHLNARAAGAIARRARVGQLLLTHCFPEWDLDATVAAAAAVAGMPVAAARQGQAVVL
jgi:ribonuclease BN (tRNA processing enzyme)